MANVDALLDLGDQDEPLSSPTGKGQGDSSDLFVVEYGENDGDDAEEGEDEDMEEEDEYQDERDREFGEQLTSTSLDEFDPFATTETTETVESVTSGDGVIRTTTVTKTVTRSRSQSHSSNASEGENLNDESQFDDLLGGLATDTMTTTSGTSPKIATTNGDVSSESNAIDDGGQGVITIDTTTRPASQTWENDVLPPTGDNLCRVCQKRVYEMEKVIADEVIYHKTCFKCNHCKRVLSLGNFASISGQLLCKPHFLELFKTKGNYEEGFGMQRHSKRWNKQARPAQSGVEASNQKTQPPNGTAEEDEYRSQPEVFLFSDTEDQVDRDEEIVHETREKEEIHFTEMSSVRTRFEDISHNAAPIFSTSVSPKTPSKWDKPKDASPPPPPVNRPRDDDNDDDDVNDNESVSPDMTRDLIAKFGHHEEQGVAISPPQSPRWKPVHRITPPRDLLRESIDEANINGVSDEEEDVNPDIVKSSNHDVNPDELPVPEKTRSIFAKFRSMEDLNAPPLSPSKPINKPFTFVDSSRSAPNLGATTDDDYVATNGDVESSPEVVRPDSEEKHLEGEFPEYGLTKNLLSMWRTLEMKNDVKALYPTTPKLQKRQSDPACRIQEPVEVVRSSATDDEAENDGEEEDSMPQPCYTRNILAKFQSMEIQPESKEGVTSKKEYKWAVKEPKLLRRPGSAKSLSSSSTGGDTDPHTDDGGSDVDQHDANEIEDENDEDAEILPQVAHTKNLLAKFRLMEDSGIPPPSPEHSARVQRSAVSVRKTTSAPAVSNGHSVNSDTEECDGRLSGEDNADIMEPDAGEFENEPQHDPDVVRGDERIVEPLPERGSTRSLMAKFQALQSTY